jgi:hypothetical protein
MPKKISNGLSIIIILTEYVRFVDNGQLLPCCQKGYHNPVELNMIAIVPVVSWGQQGNWLLGPVLNRDLPILILEDVKPYSKNKKVAKIL